MKRLVALRHPRVPISKKYGQRALPMAEFAATLHSRGRVELR
jgi:hypothetical protein